MGVTFESHIDIVLENLDEAVQTALERVGLQAESFAKANCTNKGIVNTGNLINSINHTVIAYSFSKSKEVLIGTAVEYGKYVEFGTGVNSETGGRQTPWTYPMETNKGTVFVHTNGAKAQPFLRPAVTKHVDEYKAIIEDELKKG